MAATARKLELNALLNPIQKTVSSVGSNIPSMTTGGSDGFSSTLFGFSMALLIVFLILVIIHYAITPVFSFTGGDGGILPLSDTSDGQLVWNKTPPTADLSANVLKILPTNFTIQLDVYMDNEASLSNRKRVFLYRAMSPVVLDNTQASIWEDFFLQYPESNLFMYLSPNTNDLVVSAVTVRPSGDAIFESAPTLLNVPIKEVIRITVVFLPQMMEVYLNGKLHGTKTFRFTPKASNANFYSTPDAFRQSVRVMNFKYWDRAITAAEVLNSSPPLANKSLFSPHEMSSAGVCPK
jgi:hypothetical protein